MDLFDQHGGLPEGADPPPYTGDDSSDKDQNRSGSESDTGTSSPAFTPSGPARPNPVDDVLLLGTSSFSEPDWVGVFYPPGTQPSDFLSHYASRFRTVEVDATYYATPRASTVDGWFEKTPDDFVLACKFPRAIVHGGDGPKPDPKTVLLPDATYAERDRFLATMHRMGPKLGPMVIQFPYFNKKVFDGPEPFLERLDRFLTDLPREDGDRFAVEIRNRAWLKKPFFELLRTHHVAPVLVDQAWMPHGADVAAKYDVFTGGRWAYVRLLGDRKKIEAITTSWDREVLDWGENLIRWAELLADLRDRADQIVVYANNHFAGHAPATLRRLMTLYYRARNDADFT